MKQLNKKGIANNIANNAKFAKSATKKHPKKNIPVEPKEESESNNEDNNLANTPIIPQSVYNNLPPILKQGTEAFKDARDA